MSTTEPSASADRSASQTPVTAPEIGGVQQILRGDDNFQITARDGNLFNVYVNGRSETLAESVRLGPWRRKSKSITKGLEKHVGLLNQRLESYRFAVVRTRVS